MDIIEQDLVGEQSSEASDRDIKDEFGRSQALLAWRPIDFQGLNHEKREACYELFRRGDFSWLLHPGQQQLLAWLDDRRRDVAVVVTSRQYGKTFFALLYCLAYCIKHPKSSVLFVAPHLKQLQIFMMPKLMFVLQFLPDDLLPTKTAMVWTFPNGSMFRLDGVSIGAVRLRGDRVDLVVMDECRDVPDMQSIIDSSISPMFTTAREEHAGRLILISTPPESPAHAFTDHYIRHAIERNDLFLASYMENPLLETKRLRYLLEDQYPNGIENATFKREYGADWSVTDPDKLVVREWNPQANDEFFRTYEGAPNPVRMYMGIDLGFRDATGFIIGYMDYVNGCLVVTNDFMQRGMNTDEVGAKVIEMEAELRKQLPGAMQDVIRVTDIDPTFSADMHSRFGLRTEPVFKIPSRSAMLNRLRVGFTQGRIRVHPRCVELRFQLSTAVFRSREGSTDYVKTDRTAHNDLLSALIYTNLNARWNEVLRPKEREGLRPGEMRIGAGGFANNGSFRAGILNRPGGIR